MVLRLLCDVEQIDKTHHHLTSPSVWLLHFVKCIKTKRTWPNTVTSLPCYLNFVKTMLMKCFAGRLSVPFHVIFWLLVDVHHSSSHIVRIWSVGILPTCLPVIFWSWPFWIGRSKILSRFLLCLLTLISDIQKLHSVKETLCIFNYNLTHINFKGPRLSYITTLNITLLWMLKLCLVWFFSLKRPFNSLNIN